VATNAEVRRRYIRRALELIRAANGLNAEARAELRRLGDVLRVLLAQQDLPGLGTRQMGAVAAEVEALVVARYAAIAERVVTGLREVTNIEAEFARRAAAYARAPSNAALARAAASMLILGQRPEEAWERQGQQVTQRIVAAVREASALDSTPRQVSIAIFGDGPAGRERGGILGQAQQQARSLTETGVQAAAEQGRRATYVANGANALRWQSVLDNRTTEGCALRHGLLYSLDYEPIGHSVDIERPPPRHYNCRSILVPENRAEPPQQGDTAANEFRRWLEDQTPAELADTFGQGRAELFLSGAITKADLIDQQGRVLTLAELRARLPSVP
jgi:SPP1 gp7 family putative phage head morphogenesis protein